MNDTVEHFKRIRSILIGQKPWRVNQGWGSFVTLDFGEARREIMENGREILTGEWHLWVYCCEWEIIDQSAHLLVHSESSNAEIASVLAQVQEAAFTHFEYDFHSGEIELGFENGLLMTLIPNDEYYEDAEYLMIFSPGGYVLSFGPHKTVTYHPSKQPPEMTK